MLFVVRVFRFCSRLAALGRLVGGVVPPLFCRPPLLFAVVGGLLRAVAWLVGSVFFVRFPRPRLGRLRWSFWRWGCLPASSLPAFRAAVPVWRVAPAVVVRCGACRGLVLSFWVLSCSPSLLPPCGGGGGGIAAAPAAA